MKLRDRSEGVAIIPTLARPAEVVVAVVCAFSVLFPFEGGGAFGRFGHFLNGTFGPAVQVWALWLLLCRVFRFHLSASAGVLITAIWATYSQIVLLPDSSTMGRSAGRILLTLLGNAALLVGALGVLTLARRMATRPGSQPRSESLRPSGNGTDQELSEAQRDCLSALQNLGFSRKEAAQAVELERTASDLDDMVRRCLQRLSKQPATEYAAAVSSSLEYTR